GEASREGQIRPEWFILGGVALVLGSVLVYTPVMRGDFLWDDQYFLWLNPLNVAPDGLKSIWFSTKPFDYWPVTFTVFRYEWQAWGKDPFWYHVQNILLHAGNGVMGWMILRRLSVTGAWLASMIFAVHPVNVASVAWITELKNT